MADLSEMVNYVKAQQPHSGLAETAAHFVEGASRGYDAGHAEALKKAQQDRDNPMVTDNLGLSGTPGAQVPVDVYSKLLDIKDKMLNIDNNNATLALVREQTGALDTSNRQTSLADLATTATGAANGPPTQQGRIAGIVANPDAAGSPRKATKTTISMSGGKPSVSMEFGDPKKTTVDQMSAIKSYVDKGDHEHLAAAFPDGIPEWASKFMAQQSEFKQRKDQLATEQQQHKFDKDVLTYSEKYESNPTIKSLKSQGIALGQVDQMIQLSRDGNTVSASAMGTKMARAMGEVGVLTESDIKRYVQSGKLAQGAGDKLSKWISGKPTDATMDEIQQISNTLRDSFDSKIQPITNTYVDRLSRNYHISTDEAAFRLGVEYKPVGKSGDSGDKGGGGTGNKIRVSNGKETLMIDPKDAADAAKDGYKQL